MGVPVWRPSCSILVGFSFVEKACFFLFMYQGNLKEQKKPLLSFSLQNFICTRYYGRLGNQRGVIVQWVARKFSLLFLLHFFLSIFLVVLLLFFSSLCVMYVAAFDFPQFDRVLRKGEQQRERWFRVTTEVYINISLANIVAGFTVSLLYCKCECECGWMQCSL